MRRSARVAACLASLAMVVAACGGDDDAADTAAAPTATETADASATADADAASAPDETATIESSETGTATEGESTTADTTAPPSDDPVAAGVATAQAAIDAATEPPTEIGPTIPLTGVPEKKSVAWLQCELPDCATFGAAFEQAAAALGWQLTTISVPSFAPQEGFQQAIDAGVDYIAISGTPAALIQEQIDTAKAAGIGFASCYATDPPSKDANILTQCGDGTSAGYAGSLIGNWIIADSGGSAHTLFVNLPDFPVLAAEAEGVTAAYAENCPECSLDVLDVTIDQLMAGEVPAAVVSKLQANESINYIQFSFGTLPTGVAEALDAAGLADRVKVLGVDFDVAVGLQGIVDGTHVAWTANPKPYAAWLMMDAFARDSLGMDNPEERTNAVVPLFIVDSPEEASEIMAFGPNGWPGPDGYEDQFKALWGV